MSQWASALQEIAAVPQIDRKKHQWDVIEHVLGGARLTIEEKPSPTTEPDRHREYESDRRGEHKYPAKADEEAERPSQRDRDQLKKRLEQ
jgi:hypothetical protein